MIGTELLNALYGNPLDQMARPQPAPNPNPQVQAPPQQPAPVPNTGPAAAARLTAPNMTPEQIALLNRTGYLRQMPGGAPGPVGGSPAAVSPQGGGGAPLMPGGAPAQSLPQSGPPSAAAQSPPDLAQLYLQLMQRERSANEIDRGLAMMAAANAAPGTSGAIMNSVAPRQDAGAEMGNIMQLMLTQQMMQNMPAAAASLGLTPAQAGMLGPQGIQKAIEGQVASRTAIAQKGTEQKQTDLIDAQKAAPGAITQLSSADSLANQVIGAKDASGNTIMQGITDNASKRGAAQTMLDDAQAKEPLSMAERAAHSIQINAALNPEEKATIQNLIQLRGQVYGEEFKNAGSRRTQAEIGGLVSGASQIFALNQPFSNYSKQFGDFQNKMRTTLANTYGEAGRLDDIPDSYKWNMSDPNNPKPFVDSSFLQGGDNYHGGGQWATNPPKSSFDYASIPSGTIYTAPDGTQRRKP